MRILLSNDDGYLAPGLICLEKALSEKAEVTVVAPDRNRSAASNSLTLESPIRAHVADNGYTFVDGTPTDCVHLAITGLLEQEPDMVFAGINAGSNMGDDVIYSGTVAAAMEGRFLGLPAIAVSLVGSLSGGRASEHFAHYDTAARFAVSLLERLQNEPLPADTILNVNVPDIAWDELGPVGAEQDAGPGTDFHAVRHNRISLTPLNVDLTRYTAMEQIANWVGGM
jgi:5'-nucleotidase